MRNNTFLELKTVMSLLYPKFGQCKKTGKKSVYVSDKGDKFAIVGSKEYENFRLWTSYEIDSLLKQEIYNLVIVAAFYGILVLPADFLVYYKQYSNKVKGGRDNIRIQIRNNRFFAYSNHANKEIDITKYFIPNEDELDYLMNYDREKILSDAIDFQDYDDQYVEDGNMKIRHESRTQKERIAILENHTCQICGFCESYVNKEGKKRWIIEVDHIIEKSNGGGEKIDNLLVLCPNCHAKKTYGIITISKDLKVYERGTEIHIDDHHLKIK